MTREEALLGKFNIAATYSHHVPGPTKIPELATLISTVAQSSRHVFFGEPHFNGMSLKTYEMLAQNPEIFRVAAAQGIRHFCVEFPNEFQKHVDAYASGQISRDQLHYNLFESPTWHYVCMTLSGDAVPQFQEYFLQSVDNALAAGMSVHLADVTGNLGTYSPPAEMVELAMKLVKQHAEEKSALPIVQYIADYYANLPASERDRLDQIYEDVQIERRHERTDDTQQYHYLRSRIPRDEGIMGVVGLGHLDNSGDRNASIARFLREEGAWVTCIELYDQKNSLSFLTELYAALGWTKRDKPDYTIILEDHALLDKGQQSVTWPSRQPDFL